MAEPNPFLDVARRGKNEWWRYVAGVFLVFICWVGGQVMIVPSLLLSQSDHALVDLLLFAMLLLSFAPALLGIWLAVRFLHERPFHTLITPYERVEWRRIARGFAVWFAITAAAALIEAVLYPGRYQPNPHPLTVLPFLPVAALLIPIQTGAEELFYRGYLLQGLGLLFRQPQLLALVNGILFALPHAGNPEVSVGFIQMLLVYFLAGFFWSLITLRSGTLELAWGAHTANNFFTAIVANYETTAIPSRSFFVVRQIDTSYQLVTLLVGMGLFYLILAKGWIKKNRNL